MVISLKKKPALDNVSDLTTKTVVGGLFRRLRSLLMGLSPRDPFYVAWE